jgi:hypothetical protein
MGILDPWINKLRALEPSLENGLDMAVREELELMADMQRERLSEGKSETGAPLTRNGRTGYTPNYSKVRRSKGLQTGNVDLKFTGDFHAGIKATRIAKNRVQLHSTDYKNKFLPKQYDGVYGFDAPREERLREAITRALQFKIYDYFNRR